MLKAARRFRPNIFISHGSMYAAHVAALVGKPHISLEDTDNAEQIRLYEPFTRTILTSTCFPEKFGRKQIRYEGYHELAYLHPRHFSPDPGVLPSLGVKPNEKYVIIRFVDWKATHDANHSGLSEANKILAVREFLRHARVFISAEGNMPHVLDKYRISIPPEQIHSVLHYATLYYGESGTMASECAVLGTPAIFLDDNGRRYTDEQEEKYRLVHNYSESMEDQIMSIRRGVELLKMRNLKKRYRENRVRLLNDKIDVSSFLLWFVENYPGSIRVIDDDPGYLLRFRRSISAN
jgi:predicted glycosyltransferase